MIPQAIGFFGWKRPQIAAKQRSGRGRRTPATSGNEEAPVCLADRGQPHENKTLRWKEERRVEESQSPDAEGHLGCDVMADTCAFNSSEERLRYFSSVRIDESS